MKFNQTLVFIFRSICCLDSIFFLLLSLSLSVEIPFTSINGRSRSFLCVVCLFQYIPQCNQKTITFIVEAFYSPYSMFVIIMKMMMMIMMISPKSSIFQLRSRKCLNSMSCSEVVVVVGVVVVAFQNDRTSFSTFCLLTF